MLRMPAFELHRPTTATEAAKLAHSLDDAMYVAGGTDLLVNLKHQLHSPAHLIDLTGIEELRGVSEDDDGTLHVGAGTTLQALASNEQIRTRLPGLAEAAGQVAGPQHRRMGTLGGNVMLDTRCLFYNQTEHWRQSLGHCLKKDGDWCHVIGSKATCVAASSCDTPPVLIALGAELEFLDGTERRMVAVGDLYKQDGRYEKNHLIPRDALLTTVRIPAPAKGHRSTYRKVRARGAVDYPQLGLAIVASFDGTVLTRLTAVVSAIMPKPKVLRKMDQAVGHELTDELIEFLAEQAYKQTRPQTSIHGEPAWRRHMARVEMRRGLMALRP